MKGFIFCLSGIKKYEFWFESSVDNLFFLAA